MKLHRSHRSLLKDAPVISGFLCRAADVQQPNVVSRILPRNIRNICNICANFRVN